MTLVTRRPRVRAPLAVLCLIAFVFANACGRSKPIENTAAAKDSATSPHRIVSLIPATTEMLFAMHAGDRLVAVSNYDTYPPEVARLPRVGGLLDPYVEPLLALKPDLVIVYGTQDELKTRLASVGIPMFLYTHRELRDITETMRQLGDRIGIRDAADVAARNVEQQLDAIKAKVAGQPRPRSLLVFGREAGTLRHVEASGGYGFLHDLLELAGGSDVLGDIHQAKVDMSTEMILARQPEVLIELHYGDEVRLDRLDTERAVWNALPSLPAVKHNRIHLLVGNEFVVPGPRVVQAAERLAKALHPGAW